jgi:hypothetical protein
MYLWVTSVWIVKRILKSVFLIFLRIECNVGLSVMQVSGSCECNLNIYIYMIC